MTADRGRAACVGSAPGTMYSEAGDAEGLAFARSICAGCPVKADCLAEALARNEQFGVWGGLTIHERLKVAERPCRRCLEPMSDPKRGQRYHEVCAILQRAEQPGRRPVPKAAVV